MLSNDVFDVIDVLDVIDAAPASPDTTPSCRIYVGDEWKK